MADIYNDQRVLGVRLVADGTTMYLGRPVIGLRVVADATLFSNNLRTLGIAALSADAAIFNEQPVQGAVLISDGRTLYNDRLILPVRDLAWTPLNEATLLAWWDAQNSVALNVTNASSWTDRKSGIVASQVTGANQPLYSATAANGKPGLIFDGINTYLDGASALFTAGTPAMTFVLAARSAVSDTGPRVGFALGSGGAMRTFGMYTSQVWAGDAGALSAFAGAWGAGEDHLLGWTVPAGAGVTTTAYKDGVAGTPVVGASPAALSANTFSIGKWVPSAAWMWQGVVQQIMAFNGVLPASTLRKIAGFESWYDGKAGANLQAGDLYKTRPPLITDP